MIAQVKKLVVAVAAAVSILTGSAAEVTDAEQIKIDLGIEKITVGKPADCADGAVESCITVKTEEDSLLMKICERTPDSEKFLDVESQIPSNALTAVVLNNDLAWTKGLNDNLRKFAPELADLLSVLSNVVDGVTGGVAVADVPDAEDDDGVGKMFVLGVEGQETWTALTNALTLVGEINAGTAIGGSPIKRVSLTSGGRLSALLSGRSPLLIYMPSTNDCDRVFGFSSQSVFNEWNRMIRGGSSLVHEEAFKACAGDLLQHADRGFCYVATNALKAAGTGVLKAVGLSPDVFDVPGEFWFFSTIVADKDANAVRIRMRMPKGASGTVEAAGRLALRFFENLHPELAGLVTFVEGYSPSAEAKERLGQISGALLSLRDQLGVEGLDFTTERPQQDAAKTDVRFSAERCALLARLLANGTSGHGVAENYLPATAVAAWGFQPDAETAMELLYAIFTRLGVTNVAQVIRSSFLNRGENFASDVAFAVTLGDAEHKHADGISHKGINFIAAQKLLNKEVWSLIQSALEETGAEIEVKDTGIIICHLPVSDATKELLPYVDPAICFVPNGDDSVILFSTSHETGTAAMAAGRDGTNRLVRSEMFLEQMGGEFPSHQTFRYVAPKADADLILSLGEALKQYVPESLVKALLSFDVSAVWSTGVGNMVLLDAIIPGNTIYVHKGRTSSSLYEEGKRVLDAAIDALAASVSIAYPYDYTRARRFYSQLVTLNVDSVDEHGKCRVRMLRRSTIEGAQDITVDGEITMPEDKTKVTQHTITYQNLTVKFILSSEGVFGFESTDDECNSHSFILRESMARPDFGDKGKGLTPAEIDAAVSNLWVDLGITNIVVREPRADEPEGTVCTKIEIDTTEDSFLYGLYDIDPDPATFVDNAPFLPSNTLMATVCNCDLAWAMQAADRLRDYLPDVADLLDAFRDVADGVSGGICICTVPDAEDSFNGLGKFISIGVKGVETWNLLTNKLAKAGDKYDELEKERIFDCIDCGCCLYTCPANIPLLDLIRLNKAEVMKIIRSRNQK